MARYFSTPNASRPYKRAGLVFVFEVCGRVAQQQMGILEVKEDAKANILAAYGPPVREITEAQFTEAKKNKPSGVPKWMVSPPVNPVVPFPQPGLPALLAVGSVPTESPATDSTPFQEAPPTNAPSDLDGAAPLELAAADSAPPDLPPAVEAGADVARHSGASRRSRK